MDERFIELIIIGASSAIGASITAYVAVMIAVSRTRALIKQIFRSFDALDRRMMRLESYLLENRK